MKFVDDLIELLGFICSKSCCRLIEKNDLSVGGEGLCDLDHLLLSDCQRADFLGDLECCVQSGEKLLSFLIHLIPLDHSVFNDLVADENILRDREFRVGCRDLIDRRDTCRLCVLRTLEMNFLSIQIHVTFFSCVDTGDDLDESRFAGTVLSHQRVDFASAQLELHIVECLDARENLSYSVKFEN